jgi:hypothetical protein
MTIAKDRVELDTAKFEFCGDEEKNDDLQRRDCGFSGIIS